MTIHNIWENKKRSKPPTSNNTGKYDRLRLIPILKLLSQDYSEFPAQRAPKDNLAARGAIPGMPTQIPWDCYEFHGYTLW